MSDNWTPIAGWAGLAINGGEKGRCAKEDRKKEQVTHEPGLKKGLEVVGGGEEKRKRGEGEEMRRK